MCRCPLVHPDVSSIAFIVSAFVAALPAAGDPVALAEERVVALQGAARQDQLPPVTDFSYVDSGPGTCQITSTTPGGAARDATAVEESPMTGASSEQCKTECTKSVDCGGYSWGGTGPTQRCLLFMETGLLSGGGGLIDGAHCFVKIFSSSGTTLDMALPEATPTTPPAMSATPVLPAESLAPPPPPPGETEAELRHALDVCRLEEEKLKENNEEQFKLDAARKEYGIQQHQVEALEYNLSRASAATNKCKEHEAEALATFSAWNLNLTKCEAGRKESAALIASLLKQVKEANETAANASLRALGLGKELEKEREVYKTVSATWSSVVNNEAEAAKKVTKAKEEVEMWQKRFQELFAGVNATKHEAESWLGEIGSS